MQSSGKPALAPLLAHKDRAGRVLKDADLFGSTTVVGGK